MARDKLYAYHRCVCLKSNGLLMSRIFTSILLVFSVVLAACSDIKSDVKEGAESTTASHQTIDTSPSSLTIHGVTLEDEYSWWREKGEDGEPHPYVQSLIAQENSNSESFFTQHKAVLDDIFERLKKSLPDDVRSRPRNIGGFKVTPRYLQDNDYPTYIAVHPDTGKEFVLLDQNARAGESDYYLVTDLAISPDGTKILWVEDTVGNDEFSVFVKPIGQTNGYTHEIKNTDAYAEWTADSEHIVYVTQADNSFMLYDLKDQSKSRIAVPDTMESFSIPDMTTSGDYVSLSLYMGDVQEVWVLDSNDPSNAPVMLLSREEPGNYSIDHSSDGLFYLYNSIHPTQIQTFTLNGSTRNNVTTIFEAPPGQSVGSVTFFEDYLFINVMSGMSDAAFILNKSSGNIAELEFEDELISLSLPWDEQNANANVARVKYQSFLTPPTYFDINLETGEKTIVKKTIVEGFNPENYKLTSLSVTSHDKVNVPVTFIQHVDNVGKQDVPLWLYVYGSYGLGIRSDFIDYQLPLLSYGFNLAIAHVRGGDELGIEWHRQGRLMQRKNSMKDYLAVADFFIDKKLVSTGQIFASGESAGGQIVGYAINEHPELFHSASGLVPVVDFLNALLDISIPYTRSERQEFGDPEDSAEAFNYIRSYSPYENIKNQAYLRINMMPIG